MTPFRVSRLATKPILRIFSSRSCFVNPKSLHNSRRIVSPSRISARSPACVNRSNTARLSVVFPDELNPVNHTVNPSFDSVCSRCVCNSLLALIGCKFGMRAFLLIAAITLAIIPAGWSAASHHRTVKRTHHKSHIRRRHRSRLSHRRPHAQRHHRRRRVRRYQLHPTAARYKQIQQALKDKGYYLGAIDGQWGPESVSALQRFQTERGIDNEGKITALALIGLGLGPKYKHVI